MPSNENKPSGKNRWRWRMAVRGMRQAYQGARGPLDRTIRAVARDHAAWLEAEVPTDIEGEDFASYDTAGEYFVEQDQEARYSLRLLNQGFVIILYHTWERHAIEWAKWERKYHHASVTGILKRLGFSIDADIHKLQRAANCLKHDSAELWKSDPEMFDSIVAASIAMNVRVTYSYHLRISDEQMDRFFEALEASGPAS
jgi:hypothetical protein